jgi:hypothetical protein
VTVDKTSDGGPAFPVSTLYGQSGMTLRDYFAAAAMQGMLAYSQNDGNGNVTNNCTAFNAGCIAYEYADAMLAARDRKPDPPVERPIEQAEDFCEE